jgi:hypothetical protein
MLLFRLPALVMLTLAIALPARAAGNLIKDGSFEIPAVPVGGFTLFPAGAQFNGWTVIGTGNVGIFSGEYTQDGFSFPAKKGKQWLDLTGNINAISGVQRTIKTVPGSAYELTLFVGNIVDTAGGLGTRSKVDVLVDGEPLTSFTNKGGADDMALTWRKFTAEFTAEHANTTITFMNGDAANDGSNGIDGISVSLVEP